MAAGRGRMSQLVVQAVPRIKTASAPHILKPGSSATPAGGPAGACEKLEPTSVRSWKRRVEAMLDERSAQREGGGHDRSRRRPDGEPAGLRGHGDYRLWHLGGAAGPGAGEGGTAAGRRA